MHHVDRNDAMKTLVRHCVVSSLSSDNLHFIFRQISMQQLSPSCHTICEMPTLLHSMKLLGVDSECRFKEWLEEEREYLDGLKKEPETETLDMEYYTELVQLYSLEYVIQNASDNLSDFYTGQNWESVQIKFTNYMQADYSGSKDMTSKRETTRRHLLENMRE